MGWRRVGTGSAHRTSITISPTIPIVYSRVYIRVRRTPTGSDEQIYGHFTNLLGTVARLTLTTGGNFSFRNSAGTEFVSQAYTLNTWYRIEIHTNNTVDNITIRIDGSEIFNGVSGTLANVGDVAVGCLVGTGGDAEYDADDWSVDDATWCDAGRVRFLLPAGVGSHNDFSFADWRAQRHQTGFDSVFGHPARSSTNPSRQTYAFDLNDIPNLGTVVSYRIGFATIDSGHTLDACIRLNGTTTDKVTGLASQTVGSLTTVPINTDVPQAGDSVEFGVEKTAGAGTLRLVCVYAVIETTGEDPPLSDDEGDRTVRVQVGSYTSVPDVKELDPFGGGLEPDLFITWPNGQASPLDLWTIPQDEWGQNAIDLQSGAGAWDNMGMRDGIFYLPSGADHNGNNAAGYGYLAIRDRQVRMLYQMARLADDAITTDSFDINFPAEASTFGIEALWVVGDGVDGSHRDLSYTGDSAKRFTASSPAADRIQSMGVGTYQIGGGYISTFSNNVFAAAFRRQFATTQLWDLVTWTGNGASLRDIPVPGLAGRQIDLAIGFPKNSSAPRFQSRFVAASTYFDIIGTGIIRVGSTMNASGIGMSAMLFVSGFDTADVPVRLTQLVVQTMAPNTQTCPTPDEGENLCITIDDPVLFGSWAPGDGSRYWFAETALDDPDVYYGGWKEDRLLAVSEIRRALSGTNFDYEIGNFSIELADDDYFVRSKLGVAPTSYFARREVEVFAITPEGRDDQATAKRFAMGFVDQDPQFDERSEAMSVRLTCRDRIGASMGWTVNGQQKVPRRVITQVNLPGAGAAVLGKGAPIPYGIISTYVQPSGNANGVTVPTPSGIVAECAIVSFEGPNTFWQSGYGNLPLGPDPVTSPAIAVQAGGELSLDVPSATYYAQIFPVNSAGQFGDPMPFCNDGLSAVVSSGNQQIQVSWVASAGAASYAVYLGTRFYDIDFIQWLGTTGTSVTFTRNPPFGTPATTDNITPGAAVTGDVQFWYYKIRSKNGDFRSDLNPTEVYGITTPQLNGSPRYRPIRIRWATTGAPQYEVLRRGAGGDFDRMWVVSSGQFNNGLHYFDDDLQDTGVIYLGGGVSSQPVGAVPTIYAGREVLPNQEEWGRLLIAGCAIQGVDDWYYTQNTENFVTEITQGDGVDFIFPKEDSAWYEYFPVRYRDLTGTDGITRRWTFGYVRGAKLAMIEAGSGSVTINLRGVESDGGGTGTLLTDIHDQFRHYLRTQVSVSGEGYLTGQWANTPRFGDDEICAIDDTTFEALREQRTTEYGAALQGAGIVGANGELVSISEDLKRWGTCMEARIGPNRFWQITTAALNENLTASGLASLTDEHDIHTRTFRPMPRQSELFNVIPYRYARNYVTNAWGVDGQRYTNDDSISRYGFAQESAAVEFHYLRDPGSVAFILGKRSRRQADIPTYVTLEGSLCLVGASYDIGQYVRVDHWRGPLMSGWRNRPLWILSNTVNPSTRRVRLECLDVTRLVPSGVGA